MLLRRKTIASVGLMLYAVLIPIDLITIVIYDLVKGSSTKVVEDLRNIAAELEADEKMLYYYSQFVLLYFCICTDTNYKRKNIL